MAAQTTTTPAPRLTITVHLDTGSSFTFEADTISTSRSPVDMRLTKLSWEGATTATGTPLYIDLERVVAVVVVER